MEIGDFVAANCLPLPAGESPVGTIRFAGHEDPAKALPVLVAYFAGDDERGAIRVVLAGADVGVLPREALLDWVAGSTKGIGYGDSAGAGLAGPPTVGSWTTLACTHEGCPQVEYVMLWDEGDPLLCPVHAAPMAPAGT